MRDSRLAYVRRRATVALTALLLVAGCSSAGPTEPPSSTNAAPPPLTSTSTAATTTQPAVTHVDVDDPPPVPEGALQALSAAGATVSQDGVAVTAHAGALREDADVQFAAPLGVVGDATFGTPVSVEHSGPLSAPLTVSWEAPGLSDWQRRTAVLVHWNEQERAWAPADAELTVDGTTLTAEVTDFSFVDWAAGVSQGLGEFTGTRVEEPKCSGQLPEWVSVTVDPDEDLAASAVRVCFAPDPNDDQVVTTRISNNRTFTQQLVMTDGGQRWAWTWGGPDQYGVPAAVSSAARVVFDSGTAFLLPPLHETAVGIGRPSTAGSTFIAATARVNPTTVTIDISAYLLDSQPIGGANNPVMNAWLQALYECGGKQLLAHPDMSQAGEIVIAVVDALGSCAEEILRHDSEFGTRFEELSRTMIAASPLTAQAAIKANRIVRQVSRAFQVVKFGELAFYTSDQLANAVVGPLTLSIRGNGQPSVPGSWTPTCRDTKADSNGLYRNIALQDEFSDTSKELWQFPGWPAAAAVGVGPLSACSAEYRAQLADFLPSSWGDPKAAQVVADAVRGLNADACPTSAQLIASFGGTDRTLVPDADATSFTGIRCVLESPRPTRWLTAVAHFADGSSKTVLFGWDITEHYWFQRDIDTQTCRSIPAEIADICASITGGVGAFAGQWDAKFSSMTINSDGTGSLVLQVPCCQSATYPVAVNGSGDAVTATVIGPPTIVGAYSPDLATGSAITFTWADGFEGQIITGRFPAGERDAFLCAPGIEDQRCYP